jgi:hypothetical protein
MAKDPNEAADRTGGLRGVSGGGWQIKNVLHSTCSFRIRPGNADRITVEPSTVSLAPGETKRVQVKLKLQGKVLPKKKGGAAYRDTVQLKSDFFEKKFVVTFQPAGYSMPAAPRESSCPCLVAVVTLYMVHLVGPDMEDLLQPPGWNARGQGEQRHILHAAVDSAQLDDASQHAQHTARGECSRSKQPERGGHDTRVE